MSLQKTKGKRRILLSFILLYCLCLPRAVGEFVNRNQKSISKNIARVIGGRTAELGEVPYQASLKKRNSDRKTYGSICGAVIIADTKLLSAAHCIYSERTFSEKLLGYNYMKLLPTSSYVAVAGSLSNVGIFPRSDGTPRGQWRLIRNATYPRKYQFPHLDISIIFVLSPFVFNSYVRPIPYASSFIDYMGSCTASGYGRTEAGNFSDVLRVADVGLMSSRYCHAMLNQNMNSYICLTGQRNDMGKGDSGGPLVCRSTGDRSEKGGGVLVGLLSGKLHGVTIFTRVSSHRKFIDSNSSYSLGTKVYLHIFICFILRNPDLLQLFRLVL